jgi:flagellar hook-associated protein 1 FlgK
MADPLFGIGVSGLAAAQAGLATTSHNIANANTPGYTRQAIVQGTQTPQFTGAGFLGRGTNVAGVQRTYSDLLEAQVRQQQSQSAQSTAYRDAIERIDNLLGDASAGLSPSIDEFFRSVDQVAARPGDVAARQGVISAGNALAARFRLLDGQMGQQRLDVERGLDSGAARATSIAKQIAALNERIVAARGSTGRVQEPNDLLDQRDQLVRELITLMRATVVPQDDGAYNIFVGSGQALVMRDRANELLTYRDPADPQNTVIGLKTGATTIELRAASLGGGEMAGLLAFREEALDPAQNALGRIGLVLARQFNDQHQRGQDVDALAGQLFFALGAPRAVPNANNTGGATLSATIASAADYGQLTTSDYRVAWDGAAWTVTRLTDATTRSFATLPQTIDGVTLNVAGAPAAGDTFVVQPTRAGARDLNVLISDARRVAAAAPIATAAAIGNGGDARISPASVNGALPLDANLRQPVTITFTSPTTFDVSGVGTGNPVGVAYSAGTPIGYNGWSATIDGNPKAGDVFTVTPNVAGIGNNGNARALAGLQTQHLVAGGSTTLQGAYAELVSFIGNKTREVQVTGEAQQKLLDEATAAREAVSGVNLDEEAANLLRYQQAYQAAAKVIAIAGSMFDAILALGN